MAGPSHHIMALPTFEKPVKLLIVASPYYKDISDFQIAGAEATIKDAGATSETVFVPGALEIPTAIGIAERMRNFDGYVALGCVVRGETSHYDTVCNDSSRSLQLLGLQGLCIGNGILTVENHKQAIVRADPSQMNKGGGAAAAALHLVAIARKWGTASKGIGFTRDIQLAGDTTA